ncbi:hypothetical protein HGQ17_01170 [Nesterenkonia sp. MY13]|uniref:Uncharacterized protein n=1 Tax=Nesterenkonia sedimenti TaxID=1463632 RepID=A0A7X8YCT0_9MICC|nr:hypothetical protein [Nesterenkonia sedimenti]NLS08636.1 hypothetical protein [Nesterenkonia sedimenti]
MYSTCNDEDRHVPEDAQPAPMPEGILPDPEVDLEEDRPEAETYEEMIETLYSEDEAYDPYNPEHQAGGPLPPGFRAPGTVWTLDLGLETLTICQQTFRFAEPERRPSDRDRIRSRILLLKERGLEGRALLQGALQVCADAIDDVHLSEKDRHEAAKSAEELLSELRRLG